MEKFDVTDYLEAKLRASLAGNLAAIALVCTLPLIPVLPRHLRWVGLLSATAIGVAARGQFRNRDIAELKLQDVRVISDTHRQNAIWEALTPQPPAPSNPEPYQWSPEEVEPLETFNWESLKSIDEYPHLMLVAGTGSGKSTLATWLAEQAQGHVIAVDPHYQPGHYPRANVITAVGSNLGESCYLPGEKPPKGVDPIEVPSELSPESSACEAIAWVYREMRDRYQRYAQGEWVGEPITVILDEFPAYSGIQGVPDKIRRIIAESRKVAIRLIFLTQGYQVKMLGLEGASDLRENLTVIRLGKFAVKSIQERLRGTPKTSPAFQHLSDTLAFLKGVKRPALVEDIPAEVPNL